MDYRSQNTLLGCDLVVDWNFKPDEIDSTLLDQKSAHEVDLAMQFEAKALHPYIWRSKAIGLLYVADKLFRAYEAANKREWERIDKETQIKTRTLEGQELIDHYDVLSISVYLLLIGCAIENLMKGIIYSKKPSLLEEDDKNLRLKKRLTHHRLASLYAEAGLAAMRLRLRAESHFCCQNYRFEVCRSYHVLRPPQSKWGFS